MKEILFIPPFLSLVTPLFAQLAGNSSSTQLSALKQNYIDSLDRLLIQDVKNNDLAAARAVLDELELPNRII